MSAIADMLAMEGAKDTADMIARLVVKDHMGGDLRFTECKLGLHAARLAAYIALKPFEGESEEDALTRLEEKEDAP